MWIKNGATVGRNIILDGRRIFNPTAEQMKMAGCTWVEPPTPEPDTREGVDKELFISAVTALIPAEVIKGTLADPEALRGAAGGMMLMTTDAAPDNTVYLDDPRVSAWLGTAGLTVKQVKEKMMELANNV